VLHSLADEHASVGSDGCGGVPDTQRVIEQDLVLPTDSMARPSTAWSPKTSLGNLRCIFSRGTRLKRSKRARIVEGEVVAPNSVLVTSP